MTVGIAAVCERESEPKIIAAADRMVTTPMGGSPIEYEHPAAKIHRMDERTELNAVAITSGFASFADELYHKVDAGLERTEDSDELSIRDVAVFTADCYNEILRESVERQVMNPLGLQLGDLKNQDQFNPQFLSDLIGDVNNLQQRIINNLQVLIAGVDQNGAEIFLVHNGDISDQKSIGYATVGSGSQPAQSEFIHTRYDDNSDESEGKRVVVSAKIRAEEAQGVGEQMDAVMVDNGGIHRLDDEVSNLRDMHKEIESKQERVKDLVLAGEELEINRIDEG